MPIVRVEMWEGRTLDQKRRLARELTDLIAEVVDCDPETVRILITDYARQDWAVGGVLQADREAPRE
jgi:4-oxalocrotonate tautomerase